jgi:hypothetical protein
MEGGFEAQRGTARPAPGFEPPVEPGAPSLQTLALVARIMRGRELAADAAGIPPLDSDQVLDLQRSAGNSLTTGALARWTEATGEGSLLERLLPARAQDPALHAHVCAALDALELQLHVRVSCVAGPAEPVGVEIRGPAGGAAFGTAALTPGMSAQAQLPFAVAFGAAAAVAPGHGLAVRLGAADGSEATAILLVPFAESAVLELGEARYVALAEAR